MSRGKTKTRKKPSVRSSRKEVPQPPHLLVISTSVQMPPSKTYACRCAKFDRYSRDGFRVCGVLQIEESHKPETKKYIRRYAVQEYDVQTRPNIGPGRRFQLTKPLAIGNGERHWVFLPKRPQQSLCTCDGFSNYNQCSHIMALRALLDAGHFPIVTPRHNPRPY